ncbi:MAG TPA: pyridoxal phosphate-dependent aminotransferase family protein, partial [Acidimicrobiales bacterium]
MPVDRLLTALVTQVSQIEERGAAKRHEPVVTAVIPSHGLDGPRVLLAGEGDRPFIRMSSNGYLGLSIRPELAAAEEAATRRFGTGPGAVRFISGTTEIHVALEARLAAFHGRPAAMCFSAAYAATLGTIVPLTTGRTAVVSDELNHNCIINATKLAAPVAKAVYRHLDLDDLDRALGAMSGECDRVLVVTDGVFSMRGDHAPLDVLRDVIARHDGAFAENAVLVVDDSHGVGAFGATGRGTEEVTGARADILVATLGKALGVNGGYVAGDQAVVDLLRETAPTYVYSNPITAGEAAAALAAIDVLDGPVGHELLSALRQRTRQLRGALAQRRQQLSTHGAVEQVDGGQRRRRFTGRDRVRVHVGGCRLPQQVDDGLVAGDV